MPFDLNFGAQFTSPRIVQARPQDGDSPLSSIHYSQHNNLTQMTAPSSSSIDPSKNLQIALTLVLQGGVNTTYLRNPASAFKIQVLADRFTSFLSDASIFWGPRHSTVLVKAGSVADPVFLNTLLYSIINGFAGMEDAPKAPILGVLRENRGFFSHISNLLRTGPDSVAKPIVDNLFPAVIQAGDAEAVALLLQATQNRSSISIDLNKSVFHVSARIHSPLELAVRSGSTEVVQVVLESGADPNRPIKINETGTENVLHLAMRAESFFDGDYPYLEMVQQLLNHGAEIDKRSIAQAVQKSHLYPQILMELVQRVPESQHTICFPPENDMVATTIGRCTMNISPNYQHQAVIEEIAQIAEKSVATSVVKKLVWDCMSTNCRNCIIDNPDVISTMLLHAANQGNLELVTFLAPYAKSLHQALAGAVRSRNHQLIAFLLENGARADGPVAYLITSPIARIQIPTTPLAEAIRQEDKELVETLADYGAWQCLNGRNHVEAVIHAAAESGSVQHLEAALHYITPVKPPSCDALTTAIARGNTECALTLLRAGTPTNKSYYFIHPEGRALSLALQMRNKDVVNALLDCGALDTDRQRRNSNKDLCSMVLAGQWGDMEVIDALASMGADLDAGVHTTALAAATASKNLQLVDHLLNLGADPGAKAELGRSPLGEAVKNKDYPMIDHLLSRGATPADSSAFLTAMECDEVALLKLCSAFKQKYPAGLESFGDELIAKAVRDNSAANVALCLGMKFNLASMVEDEFSDTVNGIDRERFECRERRVSVLGLAIQLAKDDDIQVIDLLLKSGVLVNDMAARGEQAAGNADFQRGETPLLLAITKRNRKIVDLLLKNGADINGPARRGVFCTPLQEACKIGSYDMVELLLRAGADVNSPAARRRGGTALQFAARSGSLKIVELLLLNKADPHAPGSEFGEGGTAFEFAAEYGRYHVLLLLWNSVPRDGFTAALLQSAQARAEGNGHRGCVDFITNIIHDASFGGLTEGV